MSYQSKTSESRRLPLTEFWSPRKIDRRAKRAKLGVTMGLTFVALLAGLPIASAASTPSGAPISVDFYIADPLPPRDMFSSQIVQMRADLGLPTNPEAVALAITQSESRWSRGESSADGLPLTDAEHNAFDRRQEISARILLLLDNEMESYPGLISAQLTRDIYHPELETNVQAETPQEARALARKLAAELHVPFVEPRLSPVSFESLQRLDAEVSDPQSGLAATDPDGMIVGAGVDYDKSELEISVLTEAIGERVDAESADRAIALYVEWLSARGSTESAVVVRIVGDSLPVLANDRTDSPGQSKAGINATCGLAFAMKPPGAVPGSRISAGHCVNSPWGLGGTVYHNTSKVGITHRCRDITSPNPSCATGVPGLDYGQIVRSSLPGSVIPSEYTFTQSTTGAKELLPLRTWTTGSSHSGVYYCLEGSSSLRPGVVGNYNTSCGWGTTPSSGFGRATMLGCSGDSGSLVRVGSQIVGVLSRLSGSVYWSDGAGNVCQWTSMWTPAGLVYQDLAPYAYQVILAKAGSNPRTNPLPSTRVFLRNSYNKCISADNSSWLNLTRALQWGCIGSHSAQLYGLVPAGPGYSTDIYRIVRYDGANRTCLSVDQNSAGGGTGNGALVIYWDCISTPNNAQLWRLKRHASGGDWMEIRSVLSGRCLSVPNSNPNNGPQLVLWGCINNHPAQRWETA